jgi:hypothetical protein
MTSLFPLVKRFEDAKKSPNTVILKEEAVLLEKSFRRGTVFNVVGWRDVNGKPYLIISKGSWEGLVDYDIIGTLIEEL